MSPRTPTKSKKTRRFHTFRIHSTSTVFHTFLHIFEYNAQKHRPDQRRVELQKEYANTPASFLDDAEIDSGKNIHPINCSTSTRSMLKTHQQTTETYILHTALLSSGVPNTGDTFTEFTGPRSPERTVCSPTKHKRSDIIHHHSVMVCKNDGIISVVQSD